MSAVGASSELAARDERRLTSRQSGRAWGLALAAAALLIACQVYDEGLLPSGNQGGAVSSGSGGGAATGGSSCLVDPAGCSSGGMGGAGAMGGAVGGDAGASGSAGVAGVGGASGDSSGGQGGASGDSSGASGAGSGASGDDAGMTCSTDPQLCPPDGPPVSLDLCPNDPAKTAPGKCGCGKSDADQDGDGVANCLDGCPTDPKKTAVGQCGCNRAESATGSAAYCLKALMVHRYGFNGTGTQLLDTIGAAHGTTVGGANATQASGTLDLAGNMVADYGGEGFAALPANLLTGLSDATFEVWMTWRGAGSLAGTSWQRVFDFGDQVTSNGVSSGSSYLFLTPQQTLTGNTVRVAYQLAAGKGVVVVDGRGPLPTGVAKHLAVVFDYGNRKLGLYIDGAPVGSAALVNPLSAINNAHSWLGRSGYQVDPELNGLLHELRIYNVALTAAQVKTSFDAGTDPVELQ